MTWFILLLAFNTVGFVLILALVTQSRVPDALFAISATLLSGFGSLTLIAQLLAYLLERITLRPQRRLDLRLRSSLERCAALLAISTYLLMAAAATMDPGLAVTGAALSVVSSLFLVRQFRRYWRWRAICLRRGTGVP